MIIDAARKNRFGLRALGCLVALLMPLAGAQGAVRCVENVEELKLALDQASASAEILEEVRLKSGDYFFQSGDVGYSGLLQGVGKSLTVSGGWSGTSGQCSVRGAGATRLWGMGQRRVLALTATASFTGTLILEDLGIGGGYGNDHGLVSCLAIGEQNGGVLAVRLDRIRIEHCVSGTAASVPTAQLVASGGIIVRNSLVANNDAGISLPLSIAARAGTSWIVNNTVADNVSANVNGFVGIAANALADASIRVRNNLLDRNVASAGIRHDLRVGERVSLRNNHYTGLFGTPDENLGSSSGPAGFDGAGYGLAADSPARDAGGPLVPSLQGGLDLHRLPRIVGSAVDLGAFEYSPLLSNGFE